MPPSPNLAPAKTRLIHLASTNAPAFRRLARRRPPMRHRMLPRPLWTRRSLLPPQATREACASHFDALKRGLNAGFFLWAPNHPGTVSQSFFFSFSGCIVMRAFLHQTMRCALFLQEVPMRHVVHCCILCGAARSSLSGLSHTARSHSALDPDSSVGPSSMCIPACCWTDQARQQHPHPYPALPS
jgi:hypothetical protein